MFGRRRFLAGTTAIGVATLAGCSGDETEDDGEENGGDDNDENRVIVAPDGDWRFEPEELTISVGETVTWYFDAPGHNVTSHPDASDQNENPDDAEPFASYEGDSHSSLDEEGTEFEHTFETPGEYVYVCEPHDGSMIGTIIVEE
ncbi:plastocyanin/azurin family copper-binding protein [Natronolimnohabitans sp. A-GB9]|uniref:plastocyanin/azurin family copper-binding protein n=1 Tax=Natronolimnohabitans sp. A-GB9 TaxID=3069757 RepID=UPI0027B175C9|nr:plastocyanin/azurin family copper-binding protein [Natronolimnohabitans sp. A-GB9]MDQ2050711.1 plastocyanin/azurin family copper-binding protein [Natronolimnohabitans sp. A-GB9]